MSEDQQSVFERLGGAEALTTIVDLMYHRVLNDPDLSPFFRDSTMERLRRMQFEFLASALDGPVKYSGSELTAVHAGRGITGKHFAKFCGHFADAMEEHGASAQDVDSVLGRLAMYKDKITGEANVGG